MTRYAPLSDERDRRASSKVIADALRNMPTERLRKIEDCHPLTSVRTIAGNVRRGRKETR